MGHVVYGVTAHKASTVYVKLRLTATGLPGTGLSPSVQISKNGGAYGGYAGTVTELGSTGTYKLVLATGDTNTPGNAALLVTEATVFDELVGLQVSGIPEFTVASVNDGSAGTASFITDLSSAVSSYWQDADLVFLTGNLTDQRKRVTAYDGSTKKISVFGGFTSAPANGDKFCLVTH